MASDIPNWLNHLLCSQFYVGCNYHPGLQGNEKNQFCMDCRLCLCKHCVQSHGGCIHNHLLKIWRHQYQPIIPLDVIHDLFDCSNIQVHMRYNKRTIQLNPRNYNLRGGGTSCENCGWTFGQSNEDYGYRFCSIGCKVAVLNRIARNQRQNSFGNAGGSSQSLTAQANEPPGVSRDWNQPD